MARFLQRAGYASEALILSFLSGIALHATALWVGQERFVADIFTPGLDAFLFLLITYGAVMAAIFWRRFDLRTWPRRVGFAIVVGYALVSVPIHVRSILAWSTDWVLAFPPWYSAVVIPVQVVFLGIMLALRPAARN